MLRIHALGRLVIVGDGGPIAGAAAQPRRMAVLALLARAGERGITRPKILDLLWPDSDEEHGRSVLSKALSALRRDLGAEDAFLATNNDLRLNPDVVTSDVAEFAAAIAEGRPDRSATLYVGPFLDGFRVAGAPEFERWVESERLSLSHQYTAALEKLADACSSGGDHAGAIRWRRKLAAQDPLNARHALGLMHSLAAAGDRSGALQHARIYEALVEQELDLPPDREVVALARRLRAETVPSGHQVIAPNPPAPSAGPESTRASLPDAPPAATALQEPVVPGLERSVHRGRFRAGAAAGLVVLLGLAAVTWWPASPQPSAPPVLALGRIVDHRPGATDQLARPLADMLATNLARVLDLRIVSNARMYELVGQAIAGADTSGALLGAARRAGATELLDGALYVLADGRLRLDLQRTELATGRARGAHSVSASDVFALADSGTARLVSDFGAAPLTGSVADVTTKSVAAYRLYDQGLQAFYQSDRRTAARLFRAALSEDSTFAMAAYYGALSERDSRESDGYTLFRRAVRLAPHATDRERLTILANWALAASSPALPALADTLVTHYPFETDGYLLSGISLVAAGRFLDARAPLEHAIAMDSLGLSGRQSRCSGCDALLWLTSAYTLSDSLPAAERTNRRWISLQPRAAPAWRAHTEVLAMQGKSAEALAAWRQWTVFDLSVEGALGIPAMISIMAEQYGGADEVLSGRFAATTPEREAEAAWYLALSHRHQGRLREALEESRRYRHAKLAGSSPHASIDRAFLEGQVLFELGRYRESSALFHAIARSLHGRDDIANQSRARAWALVHGANGLAAAGDTAQLAVLVDTLRVLGAESAFRLHQQLHHHARGLLLVARGQDADAVAEFRRAMDSPSSGYTRTNVELARAFIRQKRSREAIAVLQPVLRGGLEAANLYTTRTEVHELLAQAWEGVGGPGSRDSATAHYRAVARAWAGADPSFATRLAHARMRSETERMR